MMKMLSITSKKEIINKKINIFKAEVKMFGIHLRAPTTSSN